MTCRHAAGDPACSSTIGGWRAAEIEYENSEYEAKEKKRKKEQEELYARTPDVEKYSIEQFQRVGNHVVMKVRYPNCSKCSYEGNKVMVFLNVSEVEIIRWKRIDPHFRDPKLARAFTDAPPPAARFPGSKEGWEDAINYAQVKR